MTDPETPLGQLLGQYGLMWQSLVTSSNFDAKRELVLAMEDIREQASLDDDAWKEYTETLPGYDAWWLRIRENYLGWLAEALETTG
jgi:hypothetical protein